MAYVWYRSVDWGTQFTLFLRDGYHMPGIDLDVQIMHDFLMDAIS